MNRFFGMMPSDEIVISTLYYDNIGRKIHIQAGPNGWAIMYADYGCDYKDIERSAEENFREAYAIASEKIGPLSTEYDKKGEC